MRANTENKGRHTRAKLSVCALAIGLGATAQAKAQVIEIRRDGTTIVYNQSALITPENTIPIVAANPAARVQSVPTHIARSFDHAGSDAALSPQLLEAVAWAESRFNARAVSPRGALGVMQLMPDTATELGVDAADPDSNIRGGARYLRRMLETFHGDIELALAAYNAGPAAVRRHNGVPPFPQTRAYVAAVMDYMASCAQQEQ